MSFLCSTYLQSKDGQYYNVSTINRASSALCAPGRYAETIVWQWDESTRERGSIIHQGEDSEGRLETHFRICRLVREQGEASFAGSNDS